MAQVTTTILDEGPSNLVLHAFFSSDGYEGELVNSILLTPAMLTPPLSVKPHLIIMQVWYSMVWFDITLSWGDTVPRPFLTLARDTKTHGDFRHFGGYPDKATTPLAGQNGNLLLSTNGFQPAGSQGSLTIEFLKRFKQGQ